MDDFEHGTMEEETCEDLIEQVRENMPSQGEVEQLAEFFKVLGDPTRTRILLALQTSELCVNDIAEALSMERTAISHQLRILKSARLVRTRRDGRMICYSFDDSHVSSIIMQATAHIKHHFGG